MRRTLMLLLTVGLVLGVAPTSSAGPAPTWSRWSRATLHGLDTGPDRTVVVAGNTKEGYPGGRVVLLRLRRNGDVVSRSAWSPTDGRARVSDLAVYGRAAYTTGVVSPETASGGCEEIGSFGWFVRRSGVDGEQRWARTLRGWRRCTNVSSGAIGAGPGVVAIGTTSHIEGYTDIHGRILAFEPGGDVVWENPFEPFKVGGAEGYDADDVNALAVDAMGRTYAAGWAWRYPRETGADHEAVLMALDRNGGERWVRVLGEPKQPRFDDDRGTDVDVRGSRVLFGAIMDRNDGTSVAKVVMYDVHGRARWAAAFPAAGAWSNHVKVAIGANGAAYAATFQPRTTGGDDLVIRKLARGGAVRWTITMPRSRGLRDLAVGDGGFFVLTRHHVWRFPA